MSETQPGVKETAVPLDEVVASLYRSEGKIYARSVSGLYDKWRWVMVWVTQLFFYGMPWIMWGQRQALLFDLEARRFYIYGLVFYPQDLIYLSFLLIISALALFLFTAVAGRLWCGYTCPQTVYTEIFMWIEHKIEGDRPARMRLDESSMSKQKFAKKFAKQAVWIIFALWTGFTFVGYFTPIRELFNSVISLDLGPWQTFWILFYGFATYGNAGYMREQVCKYMCPYARFQSAMFDADTLIVTYDKDRGEPRGSRSRKLEEKNLKASNLGACIDCTLCVQVCPTGIDIRKGLQYECIGCGACADVCDDVMDKMGYARGLVKYTTENGLKNNWTRKQMFQHIFRPRVLIYSSILGLLVIGMLTSLALRPSFRTDVVRDRSVMARLTEKGELENVYRLQIMNATEALQHYKITARGLDKLRIEEDNLDANQTVSVDPAQSRWISVRLEIPDGTQPPGSHQIHFDIESVDTKEIVSEKSVFLVPR
ncbi:MAG TPA: cytochrome c oxidase accessory protein CcoG [Methylophilus sp.]|nr:cytochrome c oxidase accessory protein CcoG [Methylophilus sp.]HQQ33245.1 cytochrome c oxidase accessory protein CcoG [Methylophilus sp.]